MALLVCADCTAKYAIGLKSCPHCRSLSYHMDEEGSEMPKISKHAGPTIEGENLVVQAPHAEPIAVSSNAEPEPELGKTDVPEGSERSPMGTVVTPASPAPEGHTEDLGPQAGADDEADDDTEFVPVSGLSQPEADPAGPKY